MSTAEAFVNFFRERHGWRCRLGSAIYSDLTAFALEQAASAHSLEDLYLLFCVTNGITPKMTGRQANADIDGNRNSRDNVDG